MILQMIFSFARKVTKVTWKGLVFTMNKNMSLKVWSSPHNNRTTRATIFSYFNQNWFHLQLERENGHWNSPNSRNERNITLFWNWEFLYSTIVFFDMCFQFIRSAAGKVAIIAKMRFFSSMNHFMIFQSTWVSKRFFTGFAVVWFYSGMNF